MSTELPEAIFGNLLEDIAITIPRATQTAFSTSSGFTRVSLFFSYDITDNVFFIVIDTTGASVQRVLYKIDRQGVILNTTLDPSNVFGTDAWGDKIRGGGDFYLLDSLSTNPVQINKRDSNLNLLETIPLDTGSASEFPNTLKYNANTNTFWTAKNTTSFRGYRDFSKTGQLRTTITPDAPPANTYDFFALMDRGEVVGRGNGRELSLWDSSGVLQDTQAITLPAISEGGHNFDIPILLGSLTRDKSNSVWYSSIAFDPVENTPFTMQLRLVRLAVGLGDTSGVVRYSPKRSYLFSSLGENFNKPVTTLSLN